MVDLLIEEQVLLWTTEVAPRSARYLEGMRHAEVAELRGCARRHVGRLLERVSCRLSAPKEAS